MLKKASLLLAGVLLLTALAGCGGGATSKLTAPDDPPIPLPAELVPDNVTRNEEVFIPEDGTRQVSHDYFETDESLEDLQAFYHTALESLNGEVISEMDAKELVNSGAVPTAEEGTQDTIAWALVGTYTQSKVPVAVIIAQQGDHHGVSVGVGYRAEIMAQELKVETPKAAELSK